MRELKLNGLNNHQLANIYNIDRHTVSNILRGKVWKTILLFKPIKIDRHEEQTIYKIRELVNDNISYEVISNLLSISKSTVRKMAKGYGGYSKYQKIEPITKNLKLIENDTIIKIREDFISQKLSFIELKNKYNVCSDTISDIVCATNKYSNLEALSKKKNKRFLPEEIKNIRENYITNGITYFAKKYNVDYKTIFNIVKNISYKTVNYDELL